MTAVEAGGRLPARAMDQLHEDGVGWDWSGVRTRKQGEHMVLTTTVCNDSDPSPNEDRRVCRSWTMWAVTRDAPSGAEEAGRRRGQSRRGILMQYSCAEEVRGLVERRS